MKPIKLIVCIVLGVIIGYFMIGLLKNFSISSIMDLSKHNLRNMNYYYEDNYQKNKCSIDENINDVNFWTNKICNKNKLILNIKDIQKMNVDFYSKYIETYYNSIIYKESLLSKINEIMINNKEIYIDNVKINESEKENIYKNINLKSLQNENNIKFGIVVKDTDIKRVPFLNEIKIGKGELDFNQIGRIEISEDIFILHESLDENWYFVQFNNLNGWVKKDCIALFKNYNEWESYRFDKNIAVVVDKYTMTQPISELNNEIIKFNMGMVLHKLKENEKPKIIDNQITINLEVIKIPVRNQRGYVEFKLAMIADSSGLSTEYLKYTPENILRQAFKLLGEKYSYGDKNYGVDEGSYIKRVFKSFGILMPTNLDDQALFGYEIKKIQNMIPGSLIFTNNHVMIYLGEDNKSKYVIHPFFQKGKRSNYDEQIKSIVNSVVISDLNELTVKGNTLYDEIDLIKFIAK